MYGLTNILGALLSRFKTGRGCRIDVSMFESTVEWMTYGLYYSFEGAPAPERAGASHPAIYPYGPFSTGDGQTVMVGLQNDREWAIFCEKVLERPELIADPRFATNPCRSAARRELTAIVVECFSKLTAKQVVDRLDAAPIGNARMNDMQDLWNHLQLKSRNRWTEIETPVGPIPALVPPGAPSAYSPRMDAIPSLGQHTESILLELGYSNEAIANFRSENVV
jgi:itaconate CoA-transferase